FLQVQVESRGIKGSPGGGRCQFAVCAEPTAALRRIPDFDVVPGHPEPEVVRLRVGPARGPTGMIEFDGAGVVDEGMAVVTPGVAPDPAERDVALEMVRVER